MRNAEVSDEGACRGDNGQVGVVAFVGGQKGGGDGVFRRDGEGWRRV